MSATLPTGYTSWLDWGLDQWPWGWAVTLETAKLGNDAVNAERRAIRDAARSELAEMRAEVERLKNVLAEVNTALDDVCNYDAIRDINPIQSKIQAALVTEPTP